jgi:serine protease AprX
VKDSTQLNSAGVHLCGTASKTGHDCLGAELGMEKTRVIVECRAQRLTSTVAGTIDPQLLRIDTSFSAILLNPAAADLQMSLDAEQEHLILVRGSIQPSRLDDLRTQPKVVDVNVDTELAPFDRRYGLPHCDDWLVDVGAESPTDCPIPPCDCQPTLAHGCLLDVATFLGADQLWRERINGEGVVIGVVDGGVLAEGRMDPNRPGLVPRVIDGWPVANWGTIAAWRDHGNMVAIDALGMAPKASLYDIRISDGSSSSARMSDAIAGIHWAIEKFRVTGTPQILCCGWGIYQQAHDLVYATNANHPLTRKIVEAMDEGIIVLFAAGNGGQSCAATWCNGDAGPGHSIWGANGHSRVITVGAVNKDEQLIGYSSQGPAALDEQKPDFCGISHFAGYFCSDSGTSAACAVAAGITALLKQARPTLTQDAVKRLLKSTAKDIGPPGWDRHSGAGIIQAKAAYAKLVGHRPLSRADSQRLETLELENRCLRDLFIELALDRHMHRERAVSST